MRHASSTACALAIAGRLFAAEPSIHYEAAVQPWDAALGSHRVVVQVDGPAAAVRAHLDWRRRDVDPAKKAVIVVDLKSGQRVTNAIAPAITNDSGDVVFQATGGPGEYAIYFLPVKLEGGAFPVSHYTPPADTAEPAWKSSVGLTDEKWKSLAEAKPIGWEARSAHDAWNEMEIIATKAEEAVLAEKFKDRPFVVFLEDAAHPVRMTDHLPQRWLDGHVAGELSSPTISGRSGEFLPFQLVVWAAKEATRPLFVKFEDFVGPAGALIPAGSFNSFVNGGTGWNGSPVEPIHLRVEAGQNQSFWCGLKVPAEVAPGRYTGEARFFLQVIGGFPADAAAKVAVTIDVTAPAPDPAGNKADAAESRLPWLNSTIGSEDEPTAGYPPLEVKDRTISCLGRRVELGENGLPSRITSFFSPDNTRVVDGPGLELLSAPMRIVLTDKEGKSLIEPRSRFGFVSKTDGTVIWLGTTYIKGGWTLEVRGAMQFDGSISFQCYSWHDEVPPAESVKFENFSVEMPRTPQSCQYVIGLGQPAGSAPEKFDWKWDVASKNQDSVWIGAVNGGLRMQLKEWNYQRPGVNIHYKRRPLVEPSFWGKDGKGGIRFEEHILSAYTGPHEIPKDTTPGFCFDLLITPFHPLNTTAQWRDRYYHSGQVPKDYVKYLDQAKTAGANVINIHQGNWLNPYINYPFLTADKLKAFTDAAHERGQRVKFYYTVRELTNWSPELFALRSMGDEIFPHGKGGGHPWLEEHLGGDYWGAWFEPGVQDASVLTQPMSRWHNYYLEGLRWLAENAGCDGLYLDDIAYDRSIMMRARRILDKHDPRGGLIDLHSWNEFHEGGAWAQCANLFMDSMPFIDRLWFGEGHVYNGPPPQHFLVEISGIPFGLMGEMLEGGGSPWIGLIHGCTGRLGWGGEPRPIWKMWDDFGVKDAAFTGWWAEKECPVQSNDPMIKASVWKKPGSTLVAVANFANEARQATLAIDWKALGLDPAKVHRYAPAMAGLQRESLRATNDPLPLPPFGGAAFIFDEGPHELAAAPPPAALGAVLWEENFSDADGVAKNWKLVASAKAQVGVRFDGGLVLDVPANVHAWQERALPAETAAVSARIWQDPKDDGQQWGPGIALVWPDGKSLKVNRRHDGRLCVAPNGAESMPALMVASAPVDLTIRWDKESLRVLAAGPAMGDFEEEIAKFSRTGFPGAPSLVRAGKMPNSTRPQDHSDSGSPGFSRIDWVRVHSAK